jgi:hypothetical protein
MGADRLALLFSTRTLARLARKSIPTVALPLCFTLSNVTIIINSVVTQLKVASFAPFIALQFQPYSSTCYIFSSFGYLGEKRQYVMELSSPAGTCV